MYSDRRASRDSSVSRRLDQSPHSCGRNAAITMRWGPRRQRMTTFRCTVNPRSPSRQCTANGPVIAILEDLAALSAAKSSQTVIMDVRSVTFAH